MLKKLALAGVVSLMGTTAWSACAFENDTEIKMLSAGFEAWKAVTDAMGECGNVQAELDQEFRTKQPIALPRRWCVQRHDHAAVERGHNPSIG